MAYTAPTGNNVDFGMSGGYTAPAGDAVDFEIGAAENYYLDCPPLVITNEIPAPGMLWYTGLLPLVITQDLNSPITVLILPVPALGITQTITAAAVPRLRLSALGVTSELYIGHINEIAADTDAVGPWPFRIDSNLTVPTVVFTFIDVTFEISNVLETPVLSLDGQAVMYFPPLVVTGSINADIMPIVNVAPLIETSGLELLAIKVMPDGDQYLEMPDFNMASTLENPSLEVQVPVTPLEIIQEITLVDLYVGLSIEAAPLVLTGSIVADIFTTVSTPFLSVLSSLEGNTSIIVVPPEMAITGTLEAGIFDGATLTLPPLQMTNRLNVDLKPSVIVPPLVITQVLALGNIERFIDVPTFINAMTLECTGVRAFNFDNATIYYYFVLTGAADGETDLEMDFSNFQCRKRSGSPTYLAVTIPGVEYAEEIAARSNGTLQVYMGYRVDAETEYRKIIVEADLESINVYKGPLNKSVQLTGHKTVTPVAKAVTLETPIYLATSTGSQILRFAKPDIALEPGDTITCDSSSFVVDLITIFIKINKTGKPFSTMEISS